MGHATTAAPAPDGDEIDLAEWGRRLRARRKQRGLLQAELADAIHTTQDTISRFERGTRAPNDRQRVALARALKTSIWSLFPYPGDVG
ncbi:MAG TPA: helix-turn-helix transcriptional regulator [Jatrophihabitantaceae bacterium]|jgi:transcriptional regulator with XRE-family HTH domain